MSKLDSFVESISSTLTQDMDSRSLWPGNGVMLLAPYSTYIASNLYDLYVLSKEHNMSVMDFAKLFEAPSQVKALLGSNGYVPLKYAAKLKERLLTPGQITEYVLFMLDVLNASKETGIHKQDYGFDVYGSPDLTKADASSRRSFTSLSATLDSLVRALFFDPCFQSFMDVFHRSDSSGTYLVRNAFNLNPKELYPDFSSDFEQVVLINRFDVPLEFDFYDHPKTSKSLFSHITEFAVLSRRLGSSGFEVISNPGEINQIVDHLTGLVIARIKAVNEMSHLEVQELCCNIEYYGHRRLFEHFGYDWKPPNLAFEAISAVGEYFWTLGKSQFENRSTAEIAGLYDPRVHWKDSVIFD